MARELEDPLAIVVLNNGGGHLFDMLPIRRRLADAGALYERYFLTPPAVQPAAAARAFGLPAEEAGSADELSSALSSALAGAGATVIDARVDGESTAELVRALAAAAGRGTSTT